MGGGLCGGGSVYIIIYFYVYIYIIYILICGVADWGGVGGGGCW